MVESTIHSRNVSSMSQGAVTFLDVLGWKGIWERQEDASTILTALINELQTLADNLTNEQGKKLNSYRGLKVEIKSISDTIAFFTSGKASITLEIHGILCQYAICKSIEKQIPVRGASCYGNFSVKENIMVGPAIDEAASWHEMADWIGVIQTPSAMLQCYSYDFEKLWVDHDVSIKGMGKQKLKAVNWIPSWCQDRKNINSDKKQEILLELFLKMGPLLPTISPKFINTLEFYKKMDLL